MLIAFICLNQKLKWLLKLEGIKSAKGTDTKSDSLKFETTGAGQTAPKIKVHVAFREDPGWVPKPHTVSHNHS